MKELQKGDEANIEVAFLFSKVEANGKFPKVTKFHVATTVCSPDHGAGAGCTGPGVITTFTYFEYTPELALSAFFQTWQVKSSFTLTKPSKLSTFFYTFFRASLLLSLV